MALDSFNVSIKKLRVLPGFVVQLHTQKYANTENIVYSLDAEFQGTKQNTNSSILVSEIPVPYTQSNNITDVTSYAQLTEETVSNWAKDGLVLLKGENALSDIQVQLEKRIDEILLLPPSVDLPWSS